MKTAAATPAMTVITANTPAVTTTPFFPIDDRFDSTPS
jgi:hypothetical protein